MEYWTTNDLPLTEQFSYWREVICEAFCPLVADWTTTYREMQADPREISSWVRAAPLTAVNCAEVAAWSQVTRHRKAELRRTDAEELFVNTPIRGHCVMYQDGRRSVVGPGEFAVVDSTREFSVEWIGDHTREWQCLSFRVPRAQLAPLLRDPDGIAAVHHDANAGGIDRLVLSTMLSTWSVVDQLDPGAAGGADAAFTSVLAAALGGNETLYGARREDLNDSLRASVNRYLAAHVRSHRISPTSVAIRFGISVRKLHKLYEGTGRTFARTVMAMRVEGCARELTAHPDARSLTDLAARWGFSDLSHLNRVFRAHHGGLPSQVRDAARSSAALHRAD